MDCLNTKIIECPVIVQYIDIAHEILDKNISALKGKTTRKKPIYVEGEIPKEFVKLHKEVFMTSDISFLNLIPLLSC